MAFGQEVADEQIDEQTASGAEAAKDLITVTLTSSNFDKQVMRSKDLWFVYFYAPWCTHCKALEPQWKRVAEKFEGQIKFGKINCDE